MRVRGVRLPYQFASLVVIIAFLPSCASDGRAHENFKAVMSKQVGKDASDPTTDTARLYSNRIGQSELPNGNIEIGFRQFRACRYYFEIDKNTRKIVKWRYEGTEQECTIPY